MSEYSFFFTYRYLVGPVAFIEKGHTCCTALTYPLGHKNVYLC